MIGTFGTVEFSVSEQSVNTFRDLRFTHKASYSEHKILGRCGLLEFTGTDAATCSMNITLAQHLGVNVEESLATLRDMLHGHEPSAFILGGNVMGRGLWVLESLSVDAKVIGSQGDIFEASCSLSLREYMNEAV